MNKFFISTFISALLALSNAESDTSERILRRGGGGGKLAKLQNMIDTECTASFSLSCPDDDPTDDDCTFEKPERPNFTDLSQDEIQQLKKDYRAMRQERKQQILVCACCGGYSLDEMLPFAQGSASGSDGSGSSLGTGRPGMFGGGRPGRGKGMRNRQPVDSEVDVSGGEESISSIDDGASSSSGDESSADADESP